MTEIAQHFDAKARTAISRALQDAKARGHVEVGYLHLLVAILNLGDDTIRSICSLSMSSQEEISKKLTNALASMGPQARLADAEPTFAESTRQVLEEALGFAGLKGREQISAQDLFLSALSNPTVELLLTRLRVNSNGLLHAARELLELPEPLRSPDEGLMRNLRDQVDQATNILVEVSSKLRDFELKLASNRAEEQSSD